MSTIADLPNPIQSASQLQVPLIGQARPQQVSPIQKVANVALPILAIGGGCCVGILAGMLVAKVSPFLAIGSSIGATVFTTQKLHRLIQNLSPKTQTKIDEDIEDAVYTGGVGLEAGMVILNSLGPERVLPDLFEESIQEESSPV